MTPAEAAALLAIAAAFDNRKPDETAAQAWAMALNGLRFEDCRDAIVAHYRKTDVWLMPSEVRREVARIRGDRWAKRPLVTPPASIDPDDVPALRAWEADLYRRVCDGEDVAPTAELPERVMPDLSAPLPRPEPVPRTAKPHDPEHARRKAEAVAELAARREIPVAEPLEDGAA